MKIYIVLDFFSSLWIFTLNSSLNRSVSGRLKSDPSTAKSLKPLKVLNNLLFLFILISLRYSLLTSFHANGLINIRLWQKSCLFYPFIKFISEIFCISIDFMAIGSSISKTFKNYKNPWNPIFYFVWIYFHHQQNHENSPL